jgi:hypothetical protein
MKKIPLIFSLLLLSHLVMGQNTYFQKKFGTSATEAGRSIQQLNDGNIYVLGYSNSGLFGGFDITISKLNKQGSLLWTKYIGDSLNNYGLCLNTCASGNLVISGETETATNGKDAFVCKIDTAGTVIWFQTFGDSKNQSFRYVEECFGGGFIACGFTSDLSNSNDYYVVRLNDFGIQTWTANFGGSQNDDAYMIHATADGGFIVTGDTNSDGAGGYDVEVIQMDSLGNVNWFGLYGDTLQNGCQGILALKNGGYIIYGETEISPNSAFDFFIQKLDANGTSLWRQTFGGNVSDALFSAVEATDGGFVFTGYSNSFSSGPLDLVIGKTDSLANLTWLKTFGDSGIDLGYQIIHAQDSGYLIVGNSFVNGNDDFYLLYANDSSNVIGIKDHTNEVSDLSVFPNPTMGLIKIRNPFFNKQTCHISLFRSDGAVVYTQTLACFGVPYFELQATENLTSGIYTLHLQTENSFHFSKICFQK